MLGMFLNNALYIGLRSQQNQEYRVAQELAETSGNAPPTQEQIKEASEKAGVSAKAVEQRLKSDVAFYGKETSYSSNVSPSAIRYYATTQGKLTYKVGNEELSKTEKKTLKEITPEQYQAYRQQISQGKEPSQIVVSKATGDTLKIPISATAPEGYEVFLKKSDESRLAGAEAKQLIMEARKQQQIAREGGYDIDIHKATKNKATSSLIGRERQKSLKQKQTITEQPKQPKKLNLFTSLSKQREQYLAKQKEQEELKKGGFYTAQEKEPTTIYNWDIKALEYLDKQAKEFTYFPGKSFKVKDPLIPLGVGVAKSFVGTAGFIAGFGTGRSEEQVSMLITEPKTTIQQMKQQIGYEFQTSPSVAVGEYIIGPFAIGKTLHSLNPSKTAQATRIINKIQKNAPDVLIGEATPEYYVQDITETGKVEILGKQPSTATGSYPTTKFSNVLAKKTPSVTTTTGVGGKSNFFSVKVGQTIYSYQKLGNKYIQSITDKAGETISKIYKVRERFQPSLKPGDAYFYQEDVLLDTRKTTQQPIGAFGESVLLKEDKNQLIVPERTREQSTSVYGTNFITTSDNYKVVGGSLSEINQNLVAETLSKKAEVGFKREINLNLGETKNIPKTIDIKETKYEFTPERYEPETLRLTEKEELFIFEKPAQTQVATFNRPKTNFALQIQKANKFSNLGKKIQVIDLSAQNFYYLAQGTIKKGVDSIIDAIDKRLPKKRLEYLRPKEIIEETPTITESKVDKTTAKAETKQIQKPKIEQKNILTGEKLYYIDIEATQTTTKAIPSLKSYQTQQANKITTTPTLRLNQASTPISEQKPIIERVQAPNYENAFLNKSEPVLENKPEIVTEQKPELVLEKKPELVLEQKPELKQQPSIRVINEPRILTPNKPPFTPPPPIIAPKEQESKTGLFSVQVRRKGFFREIAKAETPEQAFNIGRVAVSKSAAASFKVVSEDNDYNLASIGSKLLPKKQFFASKKEKDVFIEKKEKRIKSKGELEEITFKGLAAIRTKKSFGLFR